MHSSSPYFPKGTIHLAVIDPGVGLSRQRIAIKSKRCLYAGPDNGLLLPAAKAEGIEKAVEIKGERFIPLPLQQPRGGGTSLHLLQLTF